MSFMMILSRMWRNRRTLLVLGLAMSFVSAFFALDPLYLRSISNAALRYTIDSTPAGVFSLRLDNPAPIDLADRSTLDQELGAMITNIDPFEHSTGIFCYPKIGEKCYGDHRRAYLPTAFSNLQNHFTLVDGRFPRPSNTGRCILALLRRLVIEQHMTIVVVTHDPQVMLEADVVHELRDGRLIDTRLAASA